MDQGFKVPFAGFGSALVWRGMLLGVIHHKRAQSLPAEGMDHKEGLGFCGGIDHG